ncbi:LysR family transcriptional regulator [Streptomyces sp. NBC_01185]|uniref:LysR family transcriptional regulator n=1 Tax=Streptomyces sp. NBC_01185 TaxID=2903764 RepID=UPI003867CECF|nr:LysR family transcriptional regulator [Streptomyces sp. NBC_01185]
MLHIGRTDLNLLGPLAALLSERHVSHAAELAGMSQPAMSRALQRLRDTFDDELLVRTPGGYQLTPRAERIQRQLGAVMPRLETLFAPETFEPADAAEAFRIAGTDYASAFVPALFQRVFRDSPHSTLDFGGWHDGVFEDIDHGLVDLLFYATRKPSPGLRSEHLFDDRFMCVMARDHPLAHRPRLTLDDYLDSTHVIVATVGGRQTAIDDLLHQLRRPRTAGLSVPYHSVAPLAVPGTRLIATLPHRIAAEHASDPALRTLPAPQEIPPLSYHMSWHPRLDNDPAQRWLRDTVRSILAEPCP